MLVGHLPSVQTAPLSMASLFPNHLLYAPNLYFISPQLQLPLPPPSHPSAQGPIENRAANADPIPTHSLATTADTGINGIPGCLEASVAQFSLND